MTDSSEPSLSMVERVRPALDGLAAQIAAIPAEWTALEFRSRGARRRWVVELSRLDADGQEIAVTGRGPDIETALRLALEKGPLAPPEPEAG